MHSRDGKMNSALKSLIFFIVIAVFGLAAFIHADAAVFNCPADDVACLISAINLSNAASGKHTINLDPGTYTLTEKNNTTDGPNGLPSITGSVRIAGKGIDKTTLKRDNSSPSFFRIFHVSATGILILDGLTITGGVQHDRLDPLLLRSAGGGGIYNRGILNVINSRISDNLDSFEGGPDGSGGGIFNNSGGVIIKNSILSGNYAGYFGTGGAVNSDGILTVENSTFTKNFAPGLAGGAIYNAGSADISNTSFMSNWSDNGGAVLNAGNISITNSTFYANGADSHGGGIAGWGASAVTNSTNCTFYRNYAKSSGAGIITDGEGLVQLQNTIIAGNEASFGPGRDCSGPMVSLGNNLIGDLAGCTINIQPTDITGDPKLGVFIDNGLPGRRYVPLLPDSPAIDAGNNDVCWDLPADQLGNPRVIDGNHDGTSICDIGAIEFMPTGTARQAKPALKFFQSRRK